MASKNKEFHKNAAIMQLTAIKLAMDTQLVLSNDDPDLFKNIYKNVLCHNNNNNSNNNVRRSTIQQQFEPSQRAASPIKPRRSPTRLGPIAEVGEVGQSRQYEAILCNRNPE